MGPTKLVRDLGVPLRVTRQILAWVWPKKPNLFEFGKIPAWAIDSESRTARGYYGFPMMPDNPGFKLAYHSPATTADPDTVIRTPLPGDEETFRPCLKESHPRSRRPRSSPSPRLHVHQQP